MVACSSELCYFVKRHLKKESCPGAKRSVGCDRLRFRGRGPVGSRQKAPPALSLGTGSKLQISKGSWRTEAFLAEIASGQID